MKHLNRRDLVKTSMAGVGGLVFARFSHAQAPVISDDDPTGMALGYAADHTTVDTQKWTKKAGPGGAQQQCTNCVLYQSLDEEYGVCGIFAGKRVHAAGWCNGWVPK